MFKQLVKYLLTLTFFAFFAATNVFGQATITIGTVDAGPYSPGSTVAVPFHINDATGCISRTNVFRVEMSNAAGSFAAPVIVGSTTAFYATFVNATIPNTTAPGNGYRFRITSTSAGVATSATSNAVTINNNAGANAVVVAASLPTITTEVFGQCNGPAADPYSIYDNGSGATTLTASFYNESTQTFEATNQNILINGGYQFTPAQATYTVFVKATNAAGKISTKAYLLVNNQINSSIGQSGNGIVCIAPGVGGTAPLTYNIDITGLNGIQNNYPGNLYTFSWGDGTPNTVLTLCDVIALNGKVTHPYTAQSCGHPQAQNGRFQVGVTITNTIPNANCGNLTQPVNSFATILRTPTNAITGGIPNICTGTTLTFGNGSDPGVDPAYNCAQNPNARYRWYVDNVLQTASPTGVAIGVGFTYTFNTNGIHTVMLRAINANGGACTAADATYQVCVQDAPTASFTAPLAPVCISTTVTPINTTNPDVICNANYTYRWTVDKNTYTFAGGTSLASAQPQFNFTAPGTYKLTLRVTAPGGCTNTSAAQTIEVAPQPTVTLNPIASYCSNGQTINFDNTRVSFPGASATEGSTFLWEVTGGGGYHFVNSTPTSQYPQIFFDDFGTYRVKVTRSNACGDLSDTKDVIFQNSPTVNAGTVPAIICQAPSANAPTVVSLNGSSANGTVTSPTWTTDGSGTFSSNTSLLTSYTPSDADYTAGSVTLTLSANTGLTGNCATATSTVTLTLTKRALINSATSKTICSNDKVGYTITAANSPGSTFIWMGAVISGSASGVTASGTGSLIDDQLVNLTPASDAVIRYTITPTSANGCPGDPFTFTVTVPGVPTVVATPADPTICSDTQVNISLAASPGTRYTWTVNAPVGILGANAQPSFTTNTSITDRLVNNTTGTLTVTYTITPHAAGATACPGLPVVVTIDVFAPAVTADAGQDMNLCGVTTYALLANSPAPGTGKWTVVTGNGLTFDDDTSPTTTVRGLVNGSTYILKWTITSPNGCQSESSVTLSVTAASVGGTTAGARTVCAGNNNGPITLSNRIGNVLRWESSIDGVNWITAANSTTNDTYTYTNLTQTTQFRAVVQNGTCGPDFSSDTKITVNPVVPVADAGPNQNLCNVTIAQLGGSDPGTSTGTWSIVGAAPGVTFDNANDRNTIVRGLALDAQYTFKWTVAGLNPCPPTDDNVTITTSSPTVAGTTSGDATICAGTNTVQVTLTGYNGTITWEMSTNGGAWQTIAGQTNAILNYTGNFTLNTRFRAVVVNSNCTPPLNSTETTITVIPPAVTANAGQGSTLCNLPSITLDGNDPGTFTGTWTQESGPTAFITNANQRNTTVTGLVGGNTYTFRWTITSGAACPPSQSDVIFINKADVIASFTASPKDGCGDLNVQFTNTSNNQTGANFQWNFGDGSTSTSAGPLSHLFAQRNDGKDTTYYISLSVIGNCNPRPAYIDSVLVRPATPIARILPASTTGCGDFAIVVQNTSPGNNTKYDFYLYNGTTEVQHITKTDKSTVTFDPVSPAVRTTYTLYMVATGYCNNTEETTRIPIVVSPADIVPQFFVQNGVSSGCGPLSVVFENNSFGGTSFAYNVYNSSTGNVLVDKVVAGTAPFPYTFTTPGIYYVSITASSFCGSVESARRRIVVYAVPRPAFVADITSGCRDIRITFTNNTNTGDGTPNTSLNYEWDFGDGSPRSQLFQPTHSYHFRSTPYTVTLRATSTVSGCTDVLVRTSYITVTPPPATAFMARPDSVTSIPNYTFSFVDQTTGNPTAWRWTFGNGQTSTRQNPTVTFPDTGVYRITLIATNITGCDSAVTKTVRITGVPGQLFLPNAFMPDGNTTELRTFKAKGSGMSKWHLAIYNNYGQLMWETTTLTAKGEPVGEWDGTFKGVPVPQGVYQWQASATFINGTEWKGNSYKDELPKRVGSIHLLR